MVHGRRQNWTSWFKTVTQAGRKKDSCFWPSTFMSICLIESDKITDDDDDDDDDHDHDDDDDVNSGGGSGDANNDDGGCGCCGVDDDDGDDNIDDDDDEDGDGGGGITSNCVHFLSIIQFLSIASTLSQ
ncbi:hypothetical protein PoB_001631400 [Plakobranchus ocellatus]|uniref:Uncharacterized protein n=1 Tax=Plakobranchus ocellatus TaxID=259542 RepID=A0AAV3Z5Y9_9GAST|nr:hypothetical protein PoB_001631400 [Plakobranchus ocellatus]